MKRDNRGVSLVEIIIAIAILVLCAVPLFKSMVWNAKVNVKSRQLLAATTTAETVLENLKTDGMERFIEKNKDGTDSEIEEVQYIEEGGKKVGYSFVYPDYKMDKQNFRVQVEVRPYKNSDNPDADYNAKEVANVYRMNRATDAIYLEEERTAEEDFVRAVARGELTSEQRNEVLENLDAAYDYVISADTEADGGKLQRVEQTVRYSYNGLLLGEHLTLLYDNSRERGNLFSLYILFLPGKTNTVTVSNLNDYPVDLYLVKQGEKEMELSVNFVGTEFLTELGEEKDAGFTKGLRLRTNFPVQDAEFFYERRGTKQSLSPNQEKLEKYFWLKGLEGKQNTIRLYDVTVKVMNEGREITTLTGTVTR